MPKKNITKRHYRLEYKDFKQKNKDKEWWIHSYHPTLSSVAKEIKMSYNTAYLILHNKNKKGNQFYRIIKI